MKKWLIDGDKLFGLIYDDVEINGSMFSRIKEYMKECTIQTSTHEEETGDGIKANYCE